MTRRRSAALAAATAAAVVAGAVTAWWRQHETPEQTYRAGIEALARNDLDSVRSAIESLRDEPGFDVHRHLLQGALHLRTGDPRGGLEELTFVPATGEFREPAYLFKGEALYRQGRLTEAEQVLLRLDKLHPDHPQACRWLAAIYYDLGAVHHAAGRLEQLARLEPEDFTPYRMLAMIYADFEQYAKAIHYYQEALRRSPPEPDRVTLVREMAQAMVRKHRYADAVEVLKEVPKDAEGRALQAECHWNLGERDEARKSLARAKEWAPDSRPVLLVEARMALDAEKPGEAIPPLLRALEMDPHDFKARYQLAMAYRRLGRLDEFERELARKEVSEELRDRLAQLNRRAMDEPRNSELRDDLAEVCEKLGKNDLAAMWRKAADDCRRFEAGSR